MFGSSILEVVIGVVLVYFITSLLCTTITEWISRFFAMRSSTLKDGIKQLLSNNDKLTNDLLDHPLIKGISPKDKSGISKAKNKLPSEIPARTFALALIDLIPSIKKTEQAASTSTAATPPAPVVQQSQPAPALPADNPEQIITSLGKSIALIPDEKLQQGLNALLVSAKSETDTAAEILISFRTSVEKWFDDSMQRVGGWYKRKTQLIVLVIVLAVCFGLNVDTFGIANTLFKDANLRSSMVAAAEAQVNAPMVDNVTTRLVSEVTSLTLPVGWSSDNSTAGKSANNPTDFPGWVVKISGIFVSGLAISLGSGFWFDILSKLVNLRAAGKKPATTDEQEAAAAAKK
jgi:hypothetical protein